MNKKTLSLICSLVLTIAVQAQDDGLADIMSAMIAAKIHQDSIDTSSLVAVYDYKCQTQDADGKAVTDRMKVCLQVGQHCTRSYPYRKFREDTEGYECLAPDNLPLLRAESFCFMPEVWTNYPDGKVTVCEQMYWHPFFILGDLNTQSIMEMWTSKNALSLWNFSREEVRDASPCKQCDDFDECRRGLGNCWRQAISAYGPENYDFPAPECPKAPPVEKVFYIP